MKILRLVVPTVVTFAFAFNATAADISFNYSFSITGLPGPQPTVSGSFAGSFTPIVGSGINAASLTSIDLTIAGFTYNLANTGVRLFDGNSLPGDDYSGLFTIGGVLNEVNQIVFGTDDFFLQFVDAGGGNVPFPIFGYTTSSPPSSQSATAGITVSRISTVPDSGNSLALLALGVFGLAVFRSATGLCSRCR